MAAVKKTGDDQRSRTDEAKLQREGWGTNKSARLAIQKWEVGKVIEGQLSGMKKLPDTADKKGGHIFYLETSAGKVCYGAPAILHSTLEELVTEHNGFGFLIRIECIGKVPSKRGQEAWNFDVRTRDA